MWTLPTKHPPPVANTPPPLAQTQCAQCERHPLKGRVTFLRLPPPVVTSQARALVSAQTETSEANIKADWAES